MAHNTMIQLCIILGAFLFASVLLNGVAFFILRCVYFEHCDLRDQLRDARGQVANNQYEQDYRGRELVHFKEHHRSVCDNNRELGKHINTLVDRNEALHRRLKTLQPDEEIVLLKVELNYSSSRKILRKVSNVKPDEEEES
jgi:hypothetical protein